MLKKITDQLYLRKQKKLLSTELKHLNDQYKLTRKFPEYGTSQEENAQEVEKVQENLGLQRNFKNLIKDVKAALIKVEKGKYGICEDCGEAIEQGRLTAYPSAALCVTCANKKFHKRR